MPDCFIVCHEHPGIGTEPLTKLVILEIYDALAQSTRTGTPYQTRLTPPPADPSCCHRPQTASPA